MQNKDFDHATDYGFVASSPSTSDNESVRFYPMENSDKREREQMPRLAYFPARNSDRLRIRESGSLADSESESRSRARSTEQSSGRSRSRSPSSHRRSQSQRRERRPRSKTRRGSSSRLATPRSPKQSMERGTSPMSSSTTDVETESEYGGRRHVVIGSQPESDLTDTQFAKYNVMNDHMLRKPISELAPRILFVGANGGVAREVSKFYHTLAPNSHFLYDTYAAALNNNSPSTIPRAPVNRGEVTNFLNWLLFREMIVRILARHRPYVRVNLEGLDLGEFQPFFLPPADISPYGFFRRIWRQIVVWFYRQPEIGIPEMKALIKRMKKFAKQEIESPSNSQI